MITLSRAKRLTRLAKASGLRNYDFTAQRGVPIDRTDILAAWRAAASEKIIGATDLPFHLYLHVPFCVAKCRYCWYSSVPLTAPEQLETYIACLRDEAEAFGNATEGITFDTIYIGGGTPSLPDYTQFAEMLNIIASNFKIDKTNLNTCEMRPETASAEKLKAARDFGINRISIGAQSFCAETLSRVGRTGYAECDVRRAAAAAHEAGIGFVNLDLMAFLPGETAESFAKGVRTACLAAPETIILPDYHRNSGSERMG